MNSVSRIVAVGALAAGVLAAAPSQATKIPDGALSIAALFNPAVTINQSGNSFIADHGMTSEVDGKGSFAGATGLTGTMNGMIKFDGTINAVENQSVLDFFTFSDDAGDIFHFDLQSAQTTDLTVLANSTSASLFLLGQMWEEDGNHQVITDPTAASLTLSFNRTGDSAFSASASLSVPPGVGGGDQPPAVPEPASWAMMVGGFGLMGGMLRANRRTRTALSFS
jgi:hypothetical protein